MRYPYAPNRLAAAARALEGEAPLADRLYAAFQQMHTLLPEHFPEGELRTDFERLHGRFTHARPRDRREEAVIAVLGRMRTAELEELAQALKDLAGRVGRDAAARSPG